MELVESNTTTILHQDQKDQKDSLCRVCLTLNRNNQCIFRIGQNDSKSTRTTFDLTEKLRLCGGVQVVENDGLPTSICMRCVTKLDAAHQLREQCQKADFTLREMYGKATVNSLCVPNVKKDQYCQTDHSVNPTFAKSEDSCIFHSNNGTSCKSHFLPHITNIGNNTVNGVATAFGTNIPSVPNVRNETVDGNVDYKSVRTDSEKSFLIVKRESYKARRMSVFKRVTSMESLKNSKERQRQYIKKSMNIKRESTDNDCTINTKICDRINRKAGSENSHECPKCDRCYSSKKSLDRHILTHERKLLEGKQLHKSKERPIPVSCKICHKTFRKTDTMVRHLNVHKRANPKEVFTILKEIRDKRKLENSTGNVSATVRSISKYNEKGDHTRNRKDVSRRETREERNEGETNDLKRGDRIERKRETDRDRSKPNGKEVNTFNDITLYRCKHCAKCYSSERSLQRHLLIHDEKKFVCNICNMKFFRQDRLKSHRNRYGHDEGKVCLEPQKPPDDKSAIKLINNWIRVELDSDNEGKGFPCKICGKSYDTKKSLQKHEINTHNRAREEHCAKCGKECSGCTDKLREDQEKFSEKMKPYACGECNKTFEKELKLERHMRIHERAKEQQDANFKRFLCHICSKTFRQNTGLMFHMRTHTGYKPHVCKYCGRGFTSNSNCINHERTHTGDRPFVCHFCSAAFAKSCTLKAHITTHTGEANYHCKTCGKSFRRLKYLKEHRFTHTGEKPYACKICGTAYSHSGSLFVHEKKCKAQYSNYQNNSGQTTQTTQSCQTYCQVAPTHVSCTSAPMVAPIVTPLPQGNLSNVNGTLDVQTGKTYADDVQRINAAHAVATAAALHVHSSTPDTPTDVTPVAVRNFAVIGQMFHS